MNRHHISMLGSLLVVASLVLGVNAEEASFKVETWSDRSVDLTQLRRFDFEALPPLGRPNRTERLRCDADLRRWLQEALVDRGFVHEEEDEIDFLVHCAFQPPERSSAPRGSQTGISIQFGQGSNNRLYVELRDPQSGQPIWRGHAKKVLRKRANRDERLAAAVRAVVARLPSPPPD